MAEFSLMFWPPGCSFIDEMMNFVSERYLMQRSKNFECENPEEFIRRLYKPDKMLKKNIDKKVRGILKGGKTFSLVMIKVDNPTMKPHRKKRLKGREFCIETKRLKKDIRDKFSPKVKGYFYDILVHVADTPDESKRIERLVKKYAK